ncbi:hypothetical protein [Rheinheimera baltica]|uniref:hypothetical protein n=1 Tax=Rheinheimera baltica TaxID=67576 RepID=UPI0003F6201F|nr:hypothetical protein [Rheinheimera baltica]
MADNLKVPKVEVKATVSDPDDFSKDAQLYRRNVLLSFSVALLLVLSDTQEPSFLGIKVSSTVMWSCFLIAHIYQFIMWRLTSHIEMDTEKNFFNFKGLKKQALFAGTAKFPGKTKAQVIMLRALPIWAFVLGFFLIIYGIYKSVVIYA